MYDVAIIGGGPAGLTAALYAGRAGLSCVLFEKLFFGGQMLKTAEIDNYPGAPSIRDVFVFSASMHSQAESFGSEFKTEEVVSVNINGAVKTVITEQGSYDAKTLIFATGAFPKKLGIPGEEKFSGRGVSYCATCDGAFFKNKTAMVVGGGDTALEDALFLSSICETVYLVHRRDAFRGAKHLEERVKNTPNIELLLNYTVSEIFGDNVVKGAVLQNTKDETERNVTTDAVFVAVGTSPENSLAKDLVALDENGYIITDSELSTSRPGIFAAGDVRKKTLRQIITAASDGAEAVYAVQRYLLEQ